MRILLVDDHTVVRMAIGMILSREGHEIVGECDNGVEAISMAFELKPDAIVLDLDIPQLDGIAVMGRLRQGGSAAHVLVHTGLKSTAFTAQCIRAGASAYMLKSDDPLDMVMALKAVAKGKTWFPMDAFSSVRTGDFVEDEAQLLNRLSPRELKVLHELARGKTNKDIADDMLLSNKTVSTYKTRLLQKTNASTLQELIDFAKRNNVV